MKHLLLVLTVFLSTSLCGQYYSSNSEFLPDGTGFVNGYYIGPGADLSDADLRYADLSGADLTGANLSGADLSGAQFRVVWSLENFTDLTGADLTNANLSGAAFTGADLSGADLSGADLTGAVIWSVDLTDTDLTDTDLSGAIIWGADLTGADLSGAVLSPPEQGSFHGTIISSTTILPTGYDLDWFSSQDAMVPPQQGYTIETYSSTDLINWSLISSESFQTRGDILSLKTVYSDTSNTLESHYSVDSKNWSLIKSETIESSEDILFLKTRVVEAE